MINALHLIWIIPISVCFGYCLATLMMIAKESDKTHGAQTQNVVK